MKSGFHEALGFLRECSEALQAWPRRSAPRLPLQWCARSTALAVFTALGCLQGTTFSPGPFDFAAYATGAGCAAINFSGGAYTDSFDSSQGTYAKTKQLADGDLGVTGNATLSGQAKINGSLAALNTTIGPVPEWGAGDQPLRPGHRDRRVYQASRLAFFPESSTRDTRIAEL